MSSTVNNVALLSVTGSVGSAFAKTLIAAQQAGKIHLTILHRPSSNLSAIPSTIPRRALDVESATAADVKAAIEGIDVLVNTANKISVASEIRFVESLAAAGTLKAYIPSDYSAVNWTEAEFSDAGNPILYNKGLIIKRSAELGLPVARVTNGLFEQFIFYPAFSGLDPKANTLQLYPGSLTKPLPISSVAYVAEGVAQLVARPPSEIANKRFGIVEYYATGQEFADSFARAHSGKKTVITDFTDADVAEVRKTGLAALGAAFRQKWGTGSYEIDYVFKPEGVKARTLDESVQGALAQ